MWICVYVQDMSFVFLRILARSVWPGLSRKSWILPCSYLRGHQRGLWSHQAGPEDQQSVRQVRRLLWWSVFNEVEVNQKELKKMRGAGMFARGWEIEAKGWEKEMDARSSCLYHCFHPCPWKTGDLNFSKNNMGIKGALLVMVIRLLLHGCTNAAWSLVWEELSTGLHYPQWFPPMCYNWVSSTISVNTKEICVIIKKVQLLLQAPGGKGWEQPGLAGGHLPLCLSWLQVWAGEG